MRTYVAKGEEAEALKVGANWFVVDATDQVLGRLATKVARMLIGKDKPSFTPYLDSGDHVVVINARDIVVTGVYDSRYSNGRGNVRVYRAVRDWWPNSYLIRTAVPASELAEPIRRVAREELSVDTD